MKGLLWSQWVLSLDREMIGGQGLIESSLHSEITIRGAHRTPKNGVCSQEGLFKV